MSDLPVFHDAAEFYTATLANEGLKPEPVDMQKFAEANKIALPVAELAKRYYEQLQLDGVKYASEDKRLEDAIAIAKAYFDQAEEASKTAKAVVDTAVQKLAEAAKVLIEEQKLACTAYELIQLAALQVESINEFDAVQASKTAELDAQLLVLRAKDTKVAAAFDHTPLLVDPSKGISALNVHPNYAPGIATHLGGGQIPPEHQQTFVRQQLGINKPEDAHNQVATFLTHIQSGKSPEEAAALTRSPPSWFAQNKGLAIGGGLAAGALGLGAMALMHSKRKEREDKMRAMMLSQSMPQG